MLSPYWRQTSDVVSGTFLLFLQELWYYDVCGVKHIQSPRCFPVCTQSNAWQCKREQVFIWTTPLCAPSCHRLFNLYVRLQQFFSVYFYFFGSCFIIGNSLAKSFTSLECPIFLFSFALFVLNLAAKFPFPLCWKPEPVIRSRWQYNVDHCLPHFYAWKQFATIRCPQKDPKGILRPRIFHGRL